MADTTTGNGDDLVQSMEDHERSFDELAFLFGRETVEQADQLDIADLNLNGARLLLCLWRRSSRASPTASGCSRNCRTAPAPR